MDPTCLSLCCYASDCVPNIASTLSSGSSCGMSINCGVPDWSSVKGLATRKQGRKRLRKSVVLKDGWSLVRGLATREQEGKVWGKVVLKEGWSWVRGLATKEQEGKVRGKVVLKEAWSLVGLIFFHQEFQVRINRWIAYCNFITQSTGSYRHFSNQHQKLQTIHSSIESTPPPPKKKNKKKTTTTTTTKQILHHSLQHQKNPPAPCLPPPPPPPLSWRRKETMNKPFTPTSKIPPPRKENRRNKKKLRTTHSRIKNSPWTNTILEAEGRTGKYCTHDLLHTLWRGQPRCYDKVLGSSARAATAACLPYTCRHCVRALPCPTNPQHAQGKKQPQQPQQRFLMHYGRNNV